MSDPKRWSDGAPDAPPGVSELLSSAPTPPPFTPALRARTAARLLENITVTTPVPPASNALRWALTGSAGAGLVSLALLASFARTPSTREAPARTAAPTLRTVEPARETPRSNALEPAVAAPTNPTVPVVAERPSSPVPAPAARTHTIAVRPSNPREERDLLEAAQIALERAQDPTRALSLLQQHRRAWPRSPLEEEREYLSLRALVRAGNTAEAQRRGATFVRSHPHGIYTEPARRLLRLTP